MAKDEREEEREFLEGLKGRTGRDLAEWMTAIAAQGFTDKNAIIDWLRGQGLPFARASWLERIHRNGGRPIHADAPGVSIIDQQAPAATGKQRRQPVPVHRSASESDLSALDRLASTAKGYRPLYHLLEARVREAVPGASLSPHARYISVGAPGEFAAIAPHATEVRLGLALGDRPFDGILLQARLRGPGPSITHMVILTDARQVNDDLAVLIKAANTRVNAQTA